MLFSANTKEGAEYRKRRPNTHDDDCQVEARSPSRISPKFPQPIFLPTLKMSPAIMFPEFGLQSWKSPAAIGRDALPGILCAESSAKRLILFSNQEMQLGVSCE